jgi:hypothetical protein
MNVLTKDLEVFVDGSWAYPYLVMVPVNTLVSGVLLYSMFGPVIVVCYLGMVALLALQICSNKVLARVLMRSLTFSDTRIQYLTSVI